METLQNQFNHCIRYGGKKNLSGNDCEELYQQLLSYAFYSKEDSFGKQEINRKGGISLYGSPVVYSFKYEKSVKDIRRNIQLGSPIRVLVEPGMFLDDVSQQIDFSLTFLNQVISEKQWRISEELNSMIQIVYPPTIQEVSNWISGMWIGLDAVNDMPTLKIYMNLRHQAKQIRWQKTADVIGLFAREDMEEEMRFIMKETFEAGSPTGLGISIGENGVLGIRIYLSFEELNNKMVQEISSRYYEESTEDIIEFLNDYGEFFQPESQSMLTLDFGRDKEGILCPKPARIKVEKSCCGQKVDNQNLVETFLNKELRKMHFDTALFEQDVTRLRKHFKEVFYQYCSFGIGRKGKHISAYYEPLF